MANCICRCCGKEFIAKEYRTKYCSTECRGTGYIHKQKKKEHSPVKANVSIYDMVDEMLRLSKERGRVVQYGDLQQMMMTGRHTPACKERRKKNG
jgi:hypothetical protein